MTTAHWPSANGAKNESFVMDNMSNNFMLSAILSAFHNYLVAFVANIDQDQTAQRMQSDILSTLSTMPTHP